MSFQNWGSRELAALILLGVAIFGGAIMGASQLIAVAVLVLDFVVIVIASAAWARAGRDRIEIDDDSVLAAGPPAGLRPCLAAVVHGGRANDRALRIALLQLAESGVIEIHDDPLVGNGAYIPRAWIVLRSTTSDVRLDLGRPERLLAASLESSRRGPARLDYIDVLSAIGSARIAFERAIDEELVLGGWSTRAPFRTVAVWLSRADVVVATGVTGAVAAIMATSIPMLVAFAGLVLAGLVWVRIAAAMPARTRAGAIVDAMLTAYRRALEKTLAATDSVSDVLKVRELAWFQTPDQMIVWAMALNLEPSLTSMFARLDRQAVRSSAQRAWFPEWYGTTVRDPQRMFRSLDHLVGSAAQS